MLPICLLSGDIADQTEIGSRKEKTAGTLKFCDPSYTEDEWEADGDV